MAAAAVCLCAACEGVARLALRHSRCCQALGTCEADGAGTPGCSCYGTRHVLAGLKGRASLHAAVLCCRCSRVQRCVAPICYVCDTQAMKTGISSAIQQSSRQQTLL